MTDEYLGVRWPLLGYFASVTAMDDNIGRLLTVLDDMGIRQNTLVIFASDNGFSCGQHGFWGKGNGTAPRNMYESSIKVPFIVSHPGSIAGGRVHQGMASAYDVLPTLLEYVGLPMPERRGLVGQSFLPALLGAPMQEREPVFVFDEYGETRMIRTSEWKYVHRYPDGPHELWDLRNDPDERRNLVADAAQTVRVRDMRGALEDWFARHSDPALDATRQGVTGRGQMRPVLPGWEGRGPAYHPDTPRS
jgi:arylsulfatase A-like enzyme